MVHVIIGIGIPGSGKTSVLRRLATECDYAFISIDEMKIAHGGTLADNPHAREIWDTARERMRELLESGKSVVFDSTFTTKSGRTHFLETAHRIPDTIVEGLYFDIPLMYALERNQNRGTSGGNRADENYIRETHTLFQKEPPTPTEGFDTLIRIDEHNNLQELKVHPDSALLRHLSKLF